MATSTRKKKNTTDLDTMKTFQSIAIAQICNENKIPEQAFRLALMDFMPDDFDSVSDIPLTIAEQTLATLTATKALPQTQEIAENPTTEPLQPSQETAPHQPQQPQKINAEQTQEMAENPTTEPLQPSQETAPHQPQQPQKTNIVASSSKTISNAAAAAAVPTALEELIQESQETIELADLVHSYRNAQILENSRTRDAELILHLREKRLDTRNQVFDSLRNLNAKQPAAPELPELPGLSDEIIGLCNDLGKQLNRAA